MFNRIEIYLIHNSFLHAELYRITHVTTTFWRNFMRYTYVSEKFNLNWYNRGIVYDTSMKMKKNLRFFLLWDNIFFFLWKNFGLYTFFQRYHPVTFMPVAMQNLRTFWGVFFAVYWNLTTLRSFSKVESVVFFFIFVINIV